MSSEPVRFQPLMVVPLSRIEMLPECEENDAVRGPVLAAAGNPHAAGLVQPETAALPAPAPRVAEPETLGAACAEGERGVLARGRSGVGDEVCAAADGVDAAIGVVPPPPEPRVAARAPPVPTRTPATTSITTRRRPNRRL